MAMFRMLTLDQNILFFEELSSIMTLHHLKIVECSLSLVWTYPAMHLYGIYLKSHCPKLSEPKDMLLYEKWMMILDLFVPRLSLALWACCKQFFLQINKLLFYCIFSHLKASFYCSSDLCFRAGSQRGKRKLI